MAIDKNLKEKFLDAMIEIEPVIEGMLFYRSSFIEKGYATYISYENPKKTIIQFSFGPSDWQIGLVINVRGNKYEFKDLLENPVINNWVSQNQFKQMSSDRNITVEAFWFLELLKFSLPIIE